MATQNIYDMADTWNDAGTTFTSIKMDVTDTNSDAASLLMDLQKGSVSQWKVTKGGAVTQLGVLTLPNGSSGTPSINLGDASTGFYRNATSQWTFESNNINVLSLFASAGTSWIRQASTGAIGWTSGASTAAADVVIRRDAANTLAQRNGTNAQTFNLYDTWASASDYHRLGVKTARATLSNVSGASVTSSGLIPDGATLVGLTTKVTTGLGDTNGTTGYQVGDGSDADRWGVASAIAAGTVTQDSDWTAGTIEKFTSAQDVVITAVGGNFDGTGDIYVAAFYLIGQAD